MTDSPNSKPVERRYGEHNVTLTREGETLHGVSYVTYPVDEPPLIEVESIDRTWYREVWERRGWHITPAENGGTK